MDIDPITDHSKEERSEEDYSKELRSITKRSRTRRRNGDRDELADWPVIDDKRTEEEKKQDDEVFERLISGSL